MKELKEIIKRLPYEKPFLFMDELVRLDEKGAEGFYTFRKDEYFYQGHFKGNPVTPGVILTECMAQIGLVCLGIYLVRGSQERDSSESKPKFVLTESKVIFEKVVYPGEKVRVLSRRKYWRLGKLKCQVEMFNEKEERVCYGELSGMMR